MTNTIEFTIRATDAFSAPLRSAGTALDGFSTRLKSVGQGAQNIHLLRQAFESAIPPASRLLAIMQQLASLQAGTAGAVGGRTVPARAFGGEVAANRAYWVGDGGRPEVFIPAANGRIAAPEQVRSGETVVVNVTLPDSAWANPARAQAAGQDFGDAIARRLRERG